ncbi:di-trans,poly-cis-decaprenylcistransferase [Candidatus Saccharibacteria bacterium]|nr:di-trans,poly-cis-decaprenylcistransferase [Candidatus Saccharibacteria bacterium]
MEKLHLGFIVDGNRRWAREKNLPTLIGHQKGFDKVEMVIEELAKHDEVGYASFYLFSTENWNRTKEEVDYLMKLAQKKISSITKKLVKNNLRCVILGSETHVPPALLKALRNCEEETKNCTGMTVCICFNYGGKQEISDAVNAAIEKGEEITPETIEQNLYHPEVPACDMIIRTSGEERISGFMLWRAAYSEFLFLKKYFPDIEKEDIAEILAEYKNRNRRFGK